jgi:hypothetical protein
VNVLSSGIYIFNCNLIEAAIPENIEFILNDQVFGKISKISTIGNMQKSDFLPHVFIIPETGVYKIQYTGDAPLVCTSIGLYKIKTADNIPDYFDLDQITIYDIFKYLNIV